MRAIRKVSGLCRAAAAARSFPAIAGASITSLPAMWPQRLGASWSSMKIAAIPYVTAASAFPAKICQRSSERVKIVFSVPL